MRIVEAEATLGRNVLVVGATGRLGAAIAHALAKRGDRPVLTARDPNKLAALAAEIGRAFKEAGADLIDCSSGQVWKEEKPVYGRLFQTPFSDKIRNEIGVATIAVGAISEADHANSILAAGRADLCAIARPHLANPAWTLEAAARQVRRR